MEYQQKNIEVILLPIDDMPDKEQIQAKMTRFQQTLPLIEPDLNDSDILDEIKAVRASSNESVGVVVETNVWVSRAIGSRVVSEQMQTIIQRPDIDLYKSVELLEELTKTLSKRR